MSPDPERGQQMLAKRGLESAGGQRRGPLLVATIVGAHGRVALR
jgi:hypothetical protein